MKELDDKSAVMALINQAIGACAKGSFRLPTGHDAPAGQE
jgi:hypothetical protein